MITIQNHIGTITISPEYLSALVGYTVTSCFGVADMNDASPREALLSLIHRAKQIDKGVTIRQKDNKLIVNLHISVTFGTNIAAIADSISNKVQFAVEEATGITVSRVNVFIDGMNT
ncbi:MAG: Asp23/Gls24 family envelope stress response protein [Ruminococcus sp.]|nr:Asp23/Gls24 family envelope stress response protein [Ruminococcus sp.]